MKFPRRTRKKTRLDRIRNEVRSDELKVKSVEVTIQQRQLRWPGHVARMAEGRLIRKVYEVKEGGTGKRGRPSKTWMEEARRAYEATGENGSTQGKRAKAETS